MSNKLQPVFIIGAARSGTKLLRGLLSASPNVVSVPYDVGFLWRLGNEKVPHDELSPNSLSEVHIAKIRRVLPRILDYTAHKSNEYLFMVEKSVSNSLRVGLLHRCYPSAKFIFLVRQPLPVVESVMRQYGSKFSLRYAFRKIKYVPFCSYPYLVDQFLSRMSGSKKCWGPLYNGIQDDICNLPIDIVCAKQWDKCVSKAHEQLQNIPSSQVFRLTYEELTTDSNALHNLCEFLRIDPSYCLSKWSSTVVPQNNLKWRDGVSFEEAFRIKLFLSSCQSSHIIDINET